MPPGKLQESRLLQNHFAHRVTLRNWPGTTTFTIL